MEYEYYVKKISTHALTWSATWCNSRLESGTEFQLTHSRGVRPGSRNHPYVRLLHFNSRTHVECDVTKSCTTGRMATFQLTHSRGVRQHSQTPPSVMHYFNSRTHVECDADAVFIGFPADISTHALTWSATQSS